MITMNKWLPISIFCSFLCSTWLSAESNLIDIPEAELLDVNLEDQPTRTTTQLQESAAPVGTEAADGVEIYEVIPAQSASPQVVTTTNSEVQQGQDLEVIKLESYDEEVVEIEAPGPDEVQVATPTTAVHPYCQQNPLVKECLYSPYLSRCKKDPQSVKCTAQLEKFENFCNTFPRAYKCKKAHLAATCKQQPNLNECKPFSERYCQKYPKAVFCKYN